VKGSQWLMKEGGGIENAASSKNEIINGFNDVMTKESSENEIFGGNLSVVLALIEALGYRRKY
jgi:hypothetical protein